MTSRAHRSSAVPQIEAHRGDSVNAPENTLAAFRRAVALGAPWIELDVHPASDGVLVVIHDHKLDRTTTGCGEIRVRSSAEIQQFDAGAKFAPAFAGERVPLLSQVIELVGPSPTRLNIEVKASPPGADVPRAVVGMLRQAGHERDYVVSSFDLQALLAVRAVAPEVTLALLGDAPAILGPAVEHRLPWVHANHKTVTPEFVAEAHAKGLSVHIWTMDDPALYEHWRRVGVDKICTNRPADLLAVSRGLRR